MAIPPFPPRDLAKLVLGYLAEELLMTAYDEFLQASPYLDILRNEYDRIVMTSLKSILAEYRAVKIYVETCKPLLLRKKIFQCSNLLEIVKFLVKNIDINKLQAQELCNDKSSFSRQTVYNRSNGCDMCNITSPGACACACRLRAVKSVPVSAEASCTLETSIETTSLSDLPGNSISKRNSNRELPTEIEHSQSNLGQQSLVEQISQSGLIQPLLQTNSIQDISQSSPAPPIQQRIQVQQIQENPTTQQVAYMPVKRSNEPCSTSVKSQLSSLTNLQENATVDCDRQNISVGKSDESKQKIEEFNKIYNLVCSNNSSTGLTSVTHPSNSSDKLVCSPGSLQEFASGVVGAANDKEKQTVPDSSTSENFNSQSRCLNENRQTETLITNIKGPPLGQYFLRANTTHSPHLQVNQSHTKSQFIRIKEKPDDSKVTILSDVKVDNTYKGNNYVKMPQLLRANTVNPTMQMQTIYINGAPAFTNKRQVGPTLTYTKDEIMAMPTIIVVPSSGPSQSSEIPYTQSNVSCSKKTITTTTTSTPRVLGPLVIDVPSDSPPPKKSSLLQDENSEGPKTVTGGLVKTIDVSVASLPKDSNIAQNKTSTPNAAPPTRKSSSTPRRNSHVRVLDFATPRRILHEAINEKDPKQPFTDSSSNEKETVSDGPSDIPVLTNLVNEVTYDKADLNKSKSKSTKENKTKVVKKNNWDAELRALVVGNDIYEKPTETSKPKPKQKKSKKKKKTSSNTENIPETSDSDNSKITSLASHVTTKSNESIKSIETGEQLMKDMTSKNSETEIINNNKSEELANNIHANDKNQLKINTSDDRVDTPEAERLSLQNVIGAKLNISDLLETPYKQVLYDIQMETPKFLGPDLPDEPISDIKITSIPTPRFLNTPKGLQATPSSYSSRPTDYSSGSSYYKPDDHDYIPPSEVFECSAAVPENAQSNNEETITNCEEIEKSSKSNRPQRKCTRNVSYRSPLSISKTKYDESFEGPSISSEGSYKSAKDKKANKSMDKNDRFKSKTKSDRKKKTIVYRSPLKSKCFMKIKPRRTTPTKDLSGKGRRKSSNVTENGTVKPRKRTLSKDKNTTMAPIVSTIPTKSRRKSSTPRKLNCTKSFNSETAVQTSFTLPSNELGLEKENNPCLLQDSDNEQLALRWSDDGSQDAKPKDKEEKELASSSLPEEDDITKIKKYIETSAPPKPIIDNGEGSLQNDLIKRGFDAETAKIIERDLLDATPIQDTAIQSTSNEETSIKKIEVSLTVSDEFKSDSSTVNQLHIVQEEQEIEEVELSVHECNEDSKNFVSYQFDKSTFVPSTNLFKLKDKYSMELCIDDDLTIRLRANQYTVLFDMDPEDIISTYNPRETEDAVSSISNIEKLYTPIKDVRAQCYEIFDSTLTSIDTPLKPEVTERKVSEIVLEVEREDVKEKTEIKKRKRIQSGSLEESLSKKSKPDAQYLLQSANIQNIDIESVLSKLHGP